MKFIDTNLWIGNWPFAPLSRNEVKEVSRRLSRFDIDTAFVSTFECVFQVDPMPGNRSLRKTVARRRRLRALPVLNPGVAAWRDHLDELADWPETKAIRLLPGYHGYRLDSRSTRACVEALQSRGIRVLATARLIDERHEPPALGQWEGFLEFASSANPLIQGLSVHELRALSEFGRRFSADISFAEWEDTLRVLKGFMSTTRIMFGSLSPLQVLQAQIDKIRLSSLALNQREKVANLNAVKYFGV
jgi:hypothetical protein